MRKGHLHHASSNITGGCVWLRLCRGTNRLCLRANRVAGRDSNAIFGSFCKGYRRARGAILLEVVVSFGLLVFGMAVVGARIQSSLGIAYHSDIQTRAMILADTKLAELRAGAVEIESYDKEYDGYFGIKYPGFTWRITIDPTETEDLYMLTLEIGYNAITAKEQIINTKMEPDIEDLGTTVVRTVYRLFPSPADVNLERDFPLEQEQIDDIVAANPLPGVDLSSFDPRQIASLPPEVLESLLPLLDEFLKGGGDLETLRRLGEKLGMEDFFDMAEEAIEGEGGAEPRGAEEDADLRDRSDRRDGR